MSAPRVTPAGTAAVRRRGALVLAVALLATGGRADGAVSQAHPATSAQAHQATPALGAPGLGSFRSPRTYPAVAAPVRLRIPAAGVDASIEPRGRAPDGTAQLPTAASMVAWYSGGARPGQAGPAVLIGHVDWHHGPAVFYRLAGLRAGDSVQIDRADRSTVHYRVTGMVRVPKSRFPSELVFKPSLTPSLRLVTCGGSFDSTTRNYRDNVIVFAAPA